MERSPENPPEPTTVGQYIDLRCPSIDVQETTDPVEVARQSAIARNRIITDQMSRFAKEEMMARDLDIGGIRNLALTPSIRSMLDEVFYDPDSDKAQERLEQFGSALHQEQIERLMCALIIIVRYMREAPAPKALQERGAKAPTGEVLPNGVSVAVLRPFQDETATSGGLVMVPLSTIFGFHEFPPGTPLNLKDQAAIDLTKLTSEMHKKYPFFSGACNFHVLGTAMYPGAKGKQEVFLVIRYFVDRLRAGHMEPVEETRLVRFDDAKFLFDKRP